MMNNLVEMNTAPTASNRIRKFVDPDFNLGVDSNTTMTMSRAFSSATRAKASNYVLNKGLDENALQVAMDTDWAAKGHQGDAPQLVRDKTITRFQPTNGRGKGLKIQLVSYWIYPGSNEAQEEITHVALVNHVDFNKPLVMSDADDIQADVEENGVSNCIAPTVFAAI
jgi:hypothetical protein